MGIGSKLTQLMKEQNTNANELAIKSNVPATTIYSLIKRDSNRVDIDSLIKISRALNVPVDYFGNEPVNPQPTTIAAHFEGDEFTEAEMEDINSYVEFVKSKREKQS